MFSAEITISLSKMPLFTSFIVFYLRFTSPFDKNGCSTGKRYRLSILLSVIRKSTNSKKFYVAVGNLGQGVIGLICDRDKLREEFYVHEVGEQYNGLKRMVNYFQHNWVKSGYNSALNGFLLVSGAENIEAPTVVNEENKFYAETNFINGKIVYTEDGSNPQATSTAYTEGMTRDPAKDYKFAVVIGDNVGEITTINKD